MALFRKKAPPTRKKHIKSPKRGRKTPQARQKKSFGFSIWRLVIKLFVWLTLLVCIGLAAWLWQLDQRVQAGFNAPFKGIPAHLYARPFSLQTGDTQTMSSIKAQLIKRGYRHVNRIAQPGDYAFSENVIDIYAEVAPLNPRPRAVRLTLADERVQNIIDHTDARMVEQFELSSNLIGNLETGPVEDRILLDLQAVPELLLDALITMEDKRFARHHGVDPLGIVRAMIQNIRDGRVSQGGSTLTQQLVKNLYLDNARTLERKINEALMAIIIEWRFDKSQILERYVNTIFLGQSGNRAIHGFGLAAQFYFGRQLRDLNPGQIAMLVGMIPAPSLYNPFRNPARALVRRNLVLDTLYNNGYISAGQLELHKQSELGVVETKAGGAKRFAAFTELLNRQLLENYDRSYLQASGLKVFSTLDDRIQRLAQTQFSAALTELEGQHGIEAGTLQGSMIIVQPQTGEIITLIGGRKGQAGDFNRALDAWRPIGSLVKPAVYLTALLNPDRYSMASVIVDAPLSIDLPTGEVWQPKNYDQKYHGKVSLHDALIHSYNVPAVKVGMDVGLAAVITTLQRLGIDQELAEFPSMLLGASNLNLLQVTQMFQTIANQGNLLPLTTLRAVSSADHQALVKIRSSGVQMVNTQADFLLRSLLVDVATDGTARALQSLMPEHQFAGKTGTTNDYRDSWFAGFGDNYLAVVWVGKDDNTSTGLTGASGALRVWAKVMSKIDVRSLELDPPEGVTQVEVDLAGGGLAMAGCTQNSAQRYFVSGYEPISNPSCNPVANKLPVADKLGGWLQKLFGKKTNQNARPKPEVPVIDAFEREH